MEGFGNLKSNQAANDMRQFIGTIQRGTKDIQGDLSDIEDKLAGGIGSDHGLGTSSISEVLDNISDKVKLIFGKMMTGGVDSRIWQVHKAMGGEDLENVRQINQHFSEVNRISI